MIVHCETRDCIYNNGSGVCEAGSIEVCERTCVTFVKNWAAYVKKESEVKQDED